MQSSFTLALLLVSCAIVYSNANQRGPTPDPRVSLNLGPLTGGKNPWSFSGKGLTGKSGLEGFSLTGKWSPPGTGHSFSGTGLWRDGKGFGGSLGGSVGIGKGKSLKFKFGGGAGEPASGSLGVKMRFRRRKGALGTGHSFFGTGLWRDGKGFGGSLGGSVGIGKGKSLKFKFGGGAGEPASGSLGVKIRFRRRRRALGTGHSFFGTGMWRDGKGFGGSLGGSVGIGKGTSLTFKFGGGAGEPASGSLGVKISFRRRRSALAKMLRI